MKESNFFDEIFAEQQFEMGAYRFYYDIYYRGCTVRYSNCCSSRSRVGNRSFSRFIVVFIGIIFDMIGIASAAAVEVPFHAMAAERIKGAKQAIGIARNADRFSSFCNDVVGDIAGIISGSASALVIIEFVRTMNAENTLTHTIVSVLFTGFVSGITVGGKALGKSFAMHYSTPIILNVGKVLYFMEHRLGIRLFSKKKNKSNNGKRGK